MNKLLEKIDKKKLIPVLVVLGIIIVALIINEITHSNGGIQNDPETQNIINETSSKFQQFTYNDDKIGIGIDYSLFIPENYDENKEYPLVVFIPDAVSTKKSAKEITEQYYGANIWASASEQEKHECFVFVPAFTEKSVDDEWNTTEEIEVMVNALDYVQAQYSIDANRLYATGQSMGCMTSMYLNSKYPDLFAASVYVSGQWDVSALKPLEKQKFFYIVSEGDDKGSNGQKELKKLFDNDNVSYVNASWAATLSLEKQNQNVKKMLEENTSHCMISFEKGTVTSGEYSTGDEHMDSFNYAYRLETVRDWLFEQTK